MSGSEAVVFALVSLREAREPSALPQGGEAVAPAGDELVYIALMPDIEDYTVVRRVERPMKG